MKKPYKLKIMEESAGVLRFITVGVERQNNAGQSINGGGIRRQKLHSTNKKSNQKKVREQCVTPRIQLIRCKASYGSKQRRHRANWKSQGSS